MECDGCGACCRALPIFVSEADADLEPRIRSKAYLLPENLRKDDWAYKLHPIPDHESCPFLGVDNRCTVYPTRPRVCRDFPAGAPQCQEARERIGLPRLEANPATQTSSLS